ncbi:MAG: hypothetical protein LBR12_06125, partial [Opitutaceae bacterium]|nr:hypothetical protein [Opitutaceae bacterium]
ATAAVLSLEHDVIPAKLRYPLLRDRLLADGQILEWKPAPRQPAAPKPRSTAKPLPAITR